MSLFLVKKYIHQVKISQYHEFYLLHILMNFQSNSATHSQRRIHSG